MFKSCALKAAHTKEKDSEKKGETLASRIYKLMRIILEIITGGSITSSAPPLIIMSYQL